jgi:hypothetical protein
MPSWHAMHCTVRHGNADVREANRHVLYIALLYNNTCKYDAATATLVLMFAAVSGSQAESG